MGKGKNDYQSHSDYLKELKSRPRGRVGKGAPVASKPKPAPVAAETVVAGLKKKGFSDASIEKNFVHMTKRTKKSKK